jgi:hypothetical protein
LSISGVKSTGAEVSNSLILSKLADLSKNRKEQARTRLDKEISLFNKKMILYLYFSYTDNISCHGLIINEYDITDDK